MLCDQTELGEFGMMQIENAMVFDLSYCIALNSEHLICRVNIYENNERRIFVLVATL